MKADILIDWLTFTIRTVKADEVIKEVLRMDIGLFEYKKKSINFYTSAKVYNNIQVLYDGHMGVSADMGVCVTMSGAGCRMYEEYHNVDVIELIRRLVAMEHINITRLDIACDDKEGFLDMENVWQYALEDKYRSRMRSKQFYESYSGKQYGARSVYFGSVSSMYKLRIYDKSAQMYSPDSSLYGVHWIRLEIVLRNTYAIQAAVILTKSDDIANSVASIINDKFCFIERDDSNVSRCMSPNWWIEFLECLEYANLEAKPKVQHTVEQHAEWLDFACSRVMAKVYNAIGSENFNQIMKNGVGKLNDSDIAQIEDFKRRFGGE